MNPFKRKQIIAEKEKLIIENFNRVCKQLGMITEGVNPVVAYKAEVTTNLAKTESASNLISAVVHGKYDDLIKQNFEKKVPSRKTADYIKYSWLDNTI